MNTYKTWPFSPERFFFQGMIFLCLSASIPAVGLLWMNLSFLSLREPTKISLRVHQPPSLKTDLGLSPSEPFFSFPDLQKEIMIFLDPERPDGLSKTSRVTVSLPRAGQAQRVCLPCTLPLSCTEEGLVVFTEDSLFSVHLEKTHSNLVHGQVRKEGLSSQREEFTLSPQYSPSPFKEEIEPHSPFALLAQARNWGPDLFYEKYGDMPSRCERIEIGPLLAEEILALKPGEWLGWKEGKWKKLISLQEGFHLPIARLCGSEAGGWALEGWDEERYYRFLLLSPPAPAFKVKIEELFTSVRARSDQQMSCMIEKQWFILRPSDWVYKGERKWRVLRKQEEKQAFQSGKLVGDVFVFDGIQVKQGQKMATGHLFNASRSQMISIELPLNSSSRQMRQAKR